MALGNVSADYKMRVVLVTAYTREYVECQKKDKVGTTH